MQKELVYLGPAPAEEACAQVGQLDYPEASRVECRAYIQAIMRVCGEPPEGAVLKIKAEEHDFGTHREVVVEFDGNNQAAADYAYKCDEHAPTTWEEANMKAPTVRKARGR